MRIRFSKSRHGPVLVCTRNDGSVTGMKNQKHGGFFVRHDLMHYAVETVLGFREAFWGLVAGLDGQPARSIESFNEPGAGKGLPAEAVITEFIVGFIDQATIFSDKPLLANEINRDLHQAMADGAAPKASAITQDQLDLIVQRFMSLYTRFQALPEGEHLDLAFPSESGEALVVGHPPNAPVLRGWPNAKART